ncbi:GL18917 [Drosophila persimilis]|uniref:GL18917 n=1 Tax=Drosophila persimilis TaxID=7234 RepID=B4G818_DROPE|nr:GL18917 [Drosophila persimilis]
MSLDSDDVRRPPRRAGLHSSVIWLQEQARIQREASTFKAAREREGRKRAHLKRFVHDVCRAARDSHRTMQAVLREILQDLRDVISYVIEELRRAPRGLSMEEFASRLPLFPFRNPLTYQSLLGFLLSSVSEAMRQRPIDIGSAGDGERLVVSVDLVDVDVPPEALDPDEAAGIPQDEYRRIRFVSFVTLSLRATVRFNQSIERVFRNQYTYYSFLFANIHRFAEVPPITHQ